MARRCARAVGTLCLRFGLKLLPHVYLDDFRRFFFVCFLFIFDAQNRTRFCALFELRATASAALLCFGCLVFNFKPFVYPMTVLLRFFSQFSVFWICKFRFGTWTYSTLCSLLFTVLLSTIHRLSFGLTTTQTKDKAKSCCCSAVFGMSLFIYLIFRLQ